MDASSAQENLADPPRNLFFGVEDRRVGGRAGLEEKYLQMERGRRQALAQQVIDSAMQVADAVRTLRKFDRTGNADQVLGHLNASLEDLEKHTRNLTAEVEKSVDRYGDELDALNARDDAEALAALNTPAAAAPPTAAAGPSPAAASTTPQQLAAAGPTPLHVAQIQANLHRALDRAGAKR
jgi:hypothetical protein